MSDDRVRQLEAAILDIDAHATPFATDGDGFNTGGYIISIGSLHRALGVVGHTAVPCGKCMPDSHECADLLELRTENRMMWNAMQRAVNKPERWQEIIGEALDLTRWTK